jgi:hypothetical protein
LGAYEKKVAPGDYLGLSSRISQSQP